MGDTTKIIAFIAQCIDIEQLKSIIKNAKAHHETAVVDAAFRKLISLVPAEQPGTVEHDFWQTVNAFEFSLTDERGKTTKLSRTRQKVARVGVKKTLIDWALGGSETDGFKMLLERGMPELTGEAIVLRHANQFETSVVTAARQRLLDAGANVNAIAGVEA